MIAAHPWLGGTCSSKLRHGGRQKPHSSYNLYTNLEPLVMDLPRGMTIPISSTLFPARLTNPTWDYSQTNIEYLACYGIARAPPTFSDRIRPPELTRISPPAVEDIDVPVLLLF